MPTAVPNDTVVEIRRDRIADGGLALFEFTRRGWALQGFVHRRGDTFRAWLNRCAHLPLTLDLGDGDLLAPDGERFICHNHGALYAVDTGECTAGPCVGKHLERLAVDTSRPDVLRVDVSEVDSDRPPPPWLE